MKDFDEKKLEGLLESKRFDEARAYMKSVFTAPPRPEDKSDAAIEYALAYVRTMNKVNSSYLKSLKEANELLRQADSAGNKADDALKAAKLRADLKMA